MDSSLQYDHYRVLGVPRHATLAQIKRAYRDRVKDCHPDVSGSPRAASIFQVVHEAYTELIDPERRAAYDDRLRFYRPAAANGHGPSHHRASHEPQQDTPDRPARPMERAAFFGLHATGFFFGVAIIIGVLVGITYFTWSPLALLFCLPGLAVIPDSIAGMRMK